ncbi:transcriptional regulator NrdR [Candidatus Woesebacteria bacterium RBG_16_39_8b]|uniref:Transcriptional repressor NrdR n=1 Tax=Candidatus Woesebacteria bacterium RBG_16_39_8b TaxID=1802482 RepID=A0A1F7XFJ8_9BACT|nr:MAG: transcriptional regulator NrdR [Candidatus Woesebacteria bacterium RBG_16_39_8b]
MKCPFCASQNTQVLESRVVEEGTSIRRRRECEKCEKRFTTYEKVRGNILWVIKKSGAREPFDRDKLKRGIIRAIGKRPVSLELVDDVVEQVEREMLRQEKEEIPTSAIGKAVLTRLRKVDKVAWLRFASVYLEFADFSDFQKAIK